MIKSCINLEQMHFGDDILSIFVDNKEFLVKQWIVYPTLFDVLEKFNISHEYYEKNVAMPVVEYFITIVEGFNRPGDCPVMRRVVDLFYEKGFNVEDVFLSCTAFKNVLYKLLIENRVEQNTISSLIMILDINLSNILAIYTSKLEFKEELIQLHNNIMENHVLLTSTDIDGKITYVTDAFCDLSGYSREELLHSTHSMIRDPNQSDDLYQELWETISEGKTWEGKLKNVKKDGSYFILDTKILPIKDKQDKIVEYMAIRENITDREIFQYDPLTKVFTRRIFDEKFAILLKDMRMEQRGFSFIIADLDHFKNINDTFGHQKGDDILKEFATIILRNIRSNDMCFRWGGEEFIIILPKAQIEVAKSVAQRIRVDFNQNVKIDEKALSASFGITEYKEKDTKESIFKRADEALYKAKETGRNKVEIN